MMHKFLLLLSKKLRRNILHGLNIAVLRIAKIFVKKRQRTKMRIVFFDIRFSSNIRTLYRKARELDLPIEFALMLVDPYDYLKAKKKPIEGIRLLNRLSIKDSIWVLQSDAIVTSMLLRRYLTQFRKVDDEIKLVQLFHTIHLLGEPKSWFESMSKFDKIFCSSENMIQWFVNQGISEEVLIPTGYAGLDDLAKPKLSRQEIAKKMDLNPNKKIVLLAPTLKTASDKFGGLSIDLFKEEAIKQLNVFAEKNDVQIVFRTHPHETIDLNAFDKFSAVHLREAKKYPVANEQLAIADVMITDLSGIGAYYISTENPMIFIKMNSEPTDDVVKLLEDDQLPGSQVQKLSALLNELELIIKTPQKYYETHHKNIDYARRFIFGSYFDGKSAERYLIELGKLSNKNLNILNSTPLKEAS